MFLIFSESKNAISFFVQSVCFLLLNADLHFFPAISFINYPQKLVGGNFLVFEIFCRKKIQFFLDTSNWERDF